MSSFPTDNPDRNVTASDNKIRALQVEKFIVAAGLDDMAPVEDVDDFKSLSK
jgi:hypothetical protein